MRIARPAAVVLVLGALLFLAAPASAGGPTSVLLVSPSTGRTASLYATNEEYTTLMSQLDAEPAADPSRGMTTPYIGGDQIVVTWMIHDVQPWRVDRITLDRGGLPEWVHTTQSTGADPIAFDEAGLWHRPADAAALAGLLVDLGLTGQTGQRPAEKDEAATMSGNFDPPAAAGSGDAAGAAGAGGAGDAGSPPDDGGAVAVATWALPAVAGGIVVGVLSDRWLRRRRQGGDGGRWQLVDVPGPSA